MKRLQVVMALNFYPRGGSAFVVRSLASELSRHQCTLALAVGSLGSEGSTTNALTFYGERTPIVVHDYSAADGAFRAGRDPMGSAVPMHGSYERRSNVADRELSLIDPGVMLRQAAAWSDTFSRLAVQPDVVHLYHLTPMAMAAAQVWPEVPIVTSLMGTELKWYDNYANYSHSTERSGSSSQAWGEAMRNWAHASARVTVLSESDAHHAERILGLSKAQISLIGCGVDTDRFRPMVISDAERMAAWRHWLVEDPRGWDETCQPGSVQYRDEDLSAFINQTTGAVKPVLIFVGRFTALKRLSLLLRAYADLRNLLGEDAPPLVIWGGSPGEWENEHPVTQCRREELKGVFFVGMREHDDLPYGFACSDLLIAPSVNESFGLVYAEALACGVPVVASWTGGPASMLTPRGGSSYGWLIKPDDRQAILEAMIEAVTYPIERRHRGEAGRELVLREYSWSSVAERLKNEYVIAQQISSRDR